MYTTYPTFTVTYIKTRKCFSRNIVAYLLFETWGIRSYILKKLVYYLKTHKY